jgi:Na+-translocating ferredoxin:NAD+ oxidoreductase subunit E
MDPAPDNRPSRDIRALLALCPLLAVSDTVLGALGLGATLLATIALSTALMSVIGRWIVPEVRFGAAVLLTAGVVAALAMVMSAWLPGLQQTLGIFIPLLASNLIILTLIGAPASTPVASLNALRASALIAAALLILGVGREIVGRGTAFTGAGRLLGASFSGFEVVLFRLDMGFLLALLPPGAFIAAGLLLAARNAFATLPRRSA